MKLILVLALLCAGSVARGTNYYFSAVSGNDNYSSIQAQNPATPWRSIEKLNSFFSSITAGDSILFKRGETFYGTIIIDKSGTAGNLIKISAYGTGSNPVITGLSPVFSWKNLGGNKWESFDSVSTLSTLKMVVIDGINTPMGRYPNVSSTVITGGNHPVPGNNGWLNYESCLGTAQITDNELAASPDWTGAQAVIKKFNWIIDIGRITSHSGDTINYIPTAVEAGFIEARPDMSYFIQDDIRTLDEQNEWYYNPLTKKITIYSLASPTGVQVATVQNVIVGNDNNYISITNLDIQGSNDNLILPSFNSTGWVISGCTISFAGRDGLFTNSPTIFNITGNNIHDINNNGIMIWNGGYLVTVNDNVLTNIGINPGMSDQSKNFSMEGLHCFGSNINILRNRLSHIGNNGIRFEGNNALVKNNFIEDFCMVKTDGGGIYTWGADGTTNYTGQVIEGNIVINSSRLGYIGSELEGLNYNTYGIYLDGSTKNITVSKNSIAHVEGSGIFMNSPINGQVIGNNVYNCRAASIQVNKDTLFASPNLNFISTNNICVARDLNQPGTWNGNSYTVHQRCFFYHSKNDDFAPNMNKVDSNVYARPMDDFSFTPDTATISSAGNPLWGKWGVVNKVVYSYFMFAEHGPLTSYSLAGWKAAFPAFDQHTKRSPKAISTPYDLRFEYNETAVSKTISLGANYLDMKNAQYPGTITLAPYTSATLIKNDVINIPPVSDAGPTQVIILPVSNIDITGNGVDYDGIVTSYNWTKISGPVAGTLTSTTSPATAATGLVAGIYKFELKVTDDDGAVGKDTLTIIYQAITVPVTLIDFSALEKSGKTLLQWSTAIEINSSHFDVERSTDGRNFEKIGALNALGNTNTQTDYQLTDSYPNSGTNYYRLKILDKDGRYVYSKIVSIEIKNRPNTGFEIRSAILSSQTLQLSITSSKYQSAVIGLYDAAGRVIFVSNVILQKAVNNIYEKLTLPAGIYYLTIKTSDEMKTLPLLN